MKEGGRKYAGSFPMQYKTSFMSEDPKKRDKSQMTKNSFKLHFSKKVRTFLQFDDFLQWKKFEFLNPDLNFSDYKTVGVEIKRKIVTIFCCWSRHKKMCIVILFLKVRSSDAL